MLLLASSVNTLIRSKLQQVSFACVGVLRPVHVDLAQHFETCIPDVNLGGRDQFSPEVTKITIKSLVWSIECFNCFLNF